MTGIDFIDLEAFKIISACPDRTDQVLQIQKMLLKNPGRADTAKSSLKACSADEGFMELFNRKYLPPFPTLEYLESCPTGSLGRALGKHLRDNEIFIDFKGLDTSPFYSDEANNKLAYIATRTIRLHDVFHALLGLGTSPVEEYALFAVQLAQFQSPYQMIILSSGYWHIALCDPDQIPKFLDAQNRYYAIGKCAKFLLGFPFEDHWNTDLNQVRTTLGLVDLPSLQENC